MSKVLNNKKLAILGMLGAVLTTWLLGGLNLFVPTPGQIKLWASNPFERCKKGSDEKQGQFTVTLSWLHRDFEYHTDWVAESLTVPSIKGFSLNRYPWVISPDIDGDIDLWSGKFRKEGRLILEECRSDLLIVGKVDDPRKALTLWFIPRTADHDEEGNPRKGTLASGNKSTYKLDSGKLGESFEESVKFQILTEALGRFLNIAEDDSSNYQQLEKALLGVIEKINQLLESDFSEKQKGRFSSTLGGAWLVLGGREENKAHFEIAEDDSSNYQQLEKALLGVIEKINQLLESDFSEKQKGRFSSALGGAWLVLGGREENKAHFEQALGAYDDALQVLTKEKFPQDWAKTQNNRGILLSKSGTLDRPRVYQNALTAYDNALSILTRDEHPRDWAIVRMNQGTALLNLGAESDLQDALNAFNDALQVLTKDRFPQNWAATKVNQGLALKTLGVLNQDKARLDGALTAFDDALQVLTKDRFPRSWATTKMNQGLTLGNLAVLSGDVATQLERSLDALDDALQVFTKVTFPQLWAQTKVRQGQALLILGILNRDKARLNDSLTASDDALQVLTKDEHPWPWARAQMHRGAALTLLGTLNRDKARLDGALIAFNDALQVLTKDEYPQFWAKAQMHRGATLTRHRQRRLGYR